MYAAVRANSASTINTTGSVSVALKRHSAHAIDAPNTESDSHAHHHTLTAESALSASDDFSDDDVQSETVLHVGLPVDGAARHVADGVRWWILALACMVMFGNYYAYDLPAALNKPLQMYLEEPDDAYQYQLNLLYSLYSLPNIVLPFFGGWMVDRFGTRRLMTFLSFLVCLGQLLFTLGVNGKRYALMHLGRIIFGLGGESLSVAQTRITTKWFKGKELAFALGINLSVSRLGTVLTDFLSPHLAISVSVPSAIWVGFFTCIVSMACAIALNFVDEYGSNLKFTAGASYELLETKAKHQKSRRGSIIAPLSPAIRPLRVASVSGTSEAKSSRHSRSRSRSARQRESSDDLADIPSMPNIKDLFEFPLPFWQVVLVMCLMFATVIPFNTIHAAFLQLKWYPGNPTKAARIMAIPDILSAILVPFVGTFVDNYGRRSKVLFICGVSMAAVHLVLGFCSETTLTSPVPVEIVLGFSYALLLTFLPCIPLVVSERRVATAFGLATSAQNLALTIFPMIVASLVTWDASYKLTEAFFCFVSMLGALVCVWMHWYDSRHLGGILDLPVSAVSDSRQD
ncbi:major facilitator superfamily domain-containing protein [Chytriomyces cf. hyalinus JEL632]|nr:major facilitator superfamily domain-containing protein [Chytriomyces cf. hyalinus JEL632]